MSIVIMIVNQSKSSKTFKVDEIEGIAPARRFDNPVDAHKHAETVANELKELDSNINVEIR